MEPEPEPEDRLEEMFERQLKFSRNFIPSKFRTDSEDGLVAYTKEMLICIHSELDELLRATGKWKTHRYEPASLKKADLLEESIDVWKYLLSIVVAYGYSPDEFFDMFRMKSKVVEARYRWEKLLDSLTPGTKVAAIDLDGVLTRYPLDWLKWINERLNRTYTVRDFGSLDLPLPMIPRDVYAKLKDVYRRTGMESLSCEPVLGAYQFIQQLKQKKYIIILLSARPFKEYKRIMPDTLIWMEQHRIEADAVIWDSEKHIRILEHFPGISFMVEDDPKVAMDVARLGYKCFLLEKPYNREVKHQNISRVLSLRQIQEMI